jgi:hypothetical protein
MSKKVESYVSPCAGEPYSSFLFRTGTWEEGVLSDHKWDPWMPSGKAGGHGGWIAADLPYSPSPANALPYGYETQHGVPQLRLT